MDRGAWRDTAHGVTMSRTRLSNFHFTLLTVYQGFPGGSDGNESACNARDPGLIPGLGRFPGELNSNPLQYACQETSTDRGA